MSVHSSQSQSVTSAATEPVAGAAPVPLPLVAVFGLAFYWSLTFLHQEAGGFSPRVYAPYASFSEVALANPKPKVDPMFELGSVVFTKYCSPCHQNTGQGTPGLFPPVAGSDWVNTSGPDRLIRLLLHGGQGPIKVNGVEFNNAMPQWGTTLKDEEIAAVLTFVRGNADWKNSAPPVSVERVAAIRKAEASRDVPWTPDELLKLPEGNP